MADTAFLAEIETRANGLKVLEERKRKKNKTAKVQVAKPAKPAAAPTNLLDLPRRSASDFTLVADLEARSEAVQLEERNKKHNKTAAALERDLESVASESRKRSVNLFDVNDLE